MIIVSILNPPKESLWIQSMSKLQRAVNACLDLESRGEDNLNQMMKPWASYEDPWYEPWNFWLFCYLCQDGSFSHLPQGCIRPEGFQERIPDFVVYQYTPHRGNSLATKHVTVKAVIEIKPGPVFQNSLGSYTEEYFKHMANDWRSKAQVRNQAKSVLESDSRLHEVYGLYCCGPFWQWIVVSRIQLDGSPLRTRRGKPADGPNIEEWSDIKSITEFGDTKDLQLL